MKFGILRHKSLHSIQFKHLPGSLFKKGEPAFSCKSIAPSKKTVKQSLKEYKTTSFRVKLVRPVL